MDDAKLTGEVALGHGRQSKAFHNRHGPRNGTQAHRKCDAEFLPPTHLQTPEERPWQEGKDKVHCRRVGSGED